MLRANINALKIQSSFGAPLTEANALKQMCVCGLGSSYLDGVEVSTSPKKEMKGRFFPRSQPLPSFPAMPPVTFWGVFLELLHV